MSSLRGAGAASAVQLLRGEESFTLSLAELLQLHSAVLYLLGTGRARDQLAKALRVEVEA